MSAPNRRQYLRLAGGTVTTALAGCTGDSLSNGDATDSESGTVTPTSTEAQLPKVEASSELDTTLTLAIGGRADDFDSLVVDIDRIEYIGQSGTDDVTVSIGDTGVDLTTLSDSKTYLDTEPFPSGTYASVDMYVSVQDNSLSDGGSVTFDYEPPASDENTIEISDDEFQNLGYTISAYKPLGESTYRFGMSYTFGSGAP